MKPLNYPHFFALLACFFVVATLKAQDVSDEYNQAMSEASEVADWDTDGDGMLDDHEFYVVNYRIWDTDNDSRISQEEWQAGTTNYISSSKTDSLGQFNDWDIDNNDSLSVNEFTLVMVNQDPFEFKTSSPGMMSQQMQQDTMMQQSDMAQQMDTMQMQQDTMMQQSGMAQQMDTTQIQQDSMMQQEPTVMIWQLDNDNLVEKITYGDWEFKFDKDDN